MTVLGALLVAGGVAQAITHGSWLPNQSAAIGDVGRTPAPPSGAGQYRPITSRTARPKPSESGRRSPSSTTSAKPTSTPTPAEAGYANPLRSITGLIPERIDMGVDFGGAGPIYALGDAVITNATGDSAGWPGGGWITYQLTSGPAKGLTVYVAEDVTPDVQVGQQVTAATVIATMFNGGAGIETGWAMPDGASAESQLTEAGAIGGSGPFPTMVGLNFEELLQSLGAPAANNRTDAPSGLLPARYPSSWAG
jgi:hypothetical protein